MSELKDIAKELCEKSGCHHKCHYTKDCVVEDEALLLINDNKSNNFDVKSNNELFKQALVEGVSRHFDKAIEQAKKNEQIEEIAKYICKSYSPYCSMCPDCYAEEEATALYNAGYRKQSEGENISEMHPSDEFICEKCGLIIRECCRYEIDEDDGDEICYEFPYRFCPRCGMKVKGGE